MDLNTVFGNADRSKKTIVQYKSLLRRLHGRVHPGDDTVTDLDWLTDTKNVMKSLSGLSASTRKLYLVPVMIALKHREMNDLYVQYLELFQKTGKEVREQTKEQTKSESESKNWVTKEEIDARINELEKQIEVAKKRGVPLDREGIKSLFGHLCLCLYTKMPPLRNDYSNLKIMRPPYAITSDKNFLYEAPPGKFTLHLAKYKTSRAYGKQTIVMSDELNAIISKSLSLFPRHFLLSQIDHPRAPMSRNYLSVFMSKIFRDKSVGSSLLRKLYITDKFSGDHSLQEREELAKQMLHSRHIAQHIYEKKH